MSPVENDGRKGYCVGSDLGVLARCKMYVNVWLGRC